MNKGKVTIIVLCCKQPEGKNGKENSHRTRFCIELIFYCCFLNSSRGACKRQNSYRPLPLWSSVDRHNCPSNPPGCLGDDVGEGDCLGNLHAGRETARICVGEVYWRGGGAKQKTSLGFRDY